jgi:FkbM family methyltransferase
VPILERRLSRVARAPFTAAHYRALLGMVRRCPDPLPNLRRYVTGWGEYPYRCRVRTPTGMIAPVLYSRHDMLTFNEVFCREDYRARRPPRVAVDIGSNIGLSALYFLTRSEFSKAYLFEPDPRNVAHLRENLAAYEPRYKMSQVAVARSDGEGAFGTEPSGRYGLLLTGSAVAHPLFPPTGRIVVRTREINTLLREVLETEDRIDVLKIDTEGSEVELVTAIREDLLDRIDTIFYESTAPTPLHEDRYKFHFSCLTNRLTQRA